MKYVQTAKLINEIIVIVADVKYIALRGNSRSNFDNKSEASNLTNPIIIAEIYASEDVLPSPECLVQLFSNVVVLFWKFFVKLQ